VPHDSDLSQYVDPDDPEAISVLIRRDYLISDPLRLRAAALRIDGTTVADPGPVSASVAGALGALFGEYEPDEIASRAEEFGWRRATPRSGSPPRTRPSRGTGSPSLSTTPTRTC